MSENIEIKVPIWFWIIGVIAVVWNFFGLYDCFNSLAMNEEYLSEFPGYLEFVKTMPIWAKAAWATATSMSVLGSIFLLLRKAWAWPVYILSIIGMIIIFTYQIMAKNAPAMTTGMIIFTMIIVVAAVFLAIYAKLMIAKGLLK